jgi:PKD repeat protein
MKAIALLAIAVIVLSGCASPKDADTDTTTSSGSATGTATKGTTFTKSSTATGTGQSSAPSTGAADQPPTAALTATSLEGQAPLNVTFTINATDADGDDLAWNLDFGDGSALATGTGTNGTLSATSTHAFAAGNHTAILNVTAGQLSTLANVTIVVQAAAAATGTLVDATLAVVFGCELCTDGEGEAIPCVGLAAGLNEGDCAWVELPAEAVGRTFTVTGASPSPLPDPLPHGVNTEIAILSACDFTGGILLFQASATNEVETGTVPAGAGCLVAWDYDETWVNIEFHFLVA